jgi:peptidoglycan/LPS O-acetylase OafA/YrhL
MNTLLRLYPRAWRERYGDEMLALLEAQPASLLDQLDLIRGAIDARLHPQVRGRGAADKEPTMNQRILALLAAVGGIIWMVGLAAWLTAPLTPTGDRDTTVIIVAVALAIACMGVAIGELGTRPGEDRSRLVGHAMTVVSLVMTALVPFSWPIFILPIFGFPVLAAIGALRGVRNGVLPAWLAVAFVVGAIAAWVGFGGTTPDDAKWVGLLFPAAFVLLAAQSLVGRQRPSEPAVT